MAAGTATDAQKRLVRYGFIKPAMRAKFKENYEGKPRKEIDKIDGTLIGQLADEEEAEEERYIRRTTGYPTPSKRYRVILESFQQSIEESYFWILDYLRVDLSFQVEKIVDAFSASENSAFFGVVQQRIGLQQEKVSAFLATIGKMTRELFQLVRELRILDERLSIYNASMGIGTEEKKKSEAAEITLKGYWIDLVEGGAKNPASVYGMSRDLGFMTLPDLFFSAPSLEPGKVDEYVDKLDFNRKIREVLKRKLHTFAEWKKHTYAELKTRRQFTLKYLRQHFNIIRMYMAWVKPYLHNLKRLALDQDKTETPDLITAFEGSVLEIEILGRTKAAGKYFPCILVSLLYRSRPSMSYQQEGYQRGPIHVGRIDIKMRAYAWTQTDIDNYKKMRSDEDMELLSMIDGSVKAAMEALGDELEKYLKEAEETYEFDKPLAEVKEKPQPKSVADPFISVFKGFGEMFGTIIPVGNKDKKTRIDKNDLYRLSLNKKDAIDTAHSRMWRLYKIYKKAHKMLSW
ncbi:hypothetical protein AUJ68_05985 [Candidatus Woesearchaeota archaeon CG1_02_57_44]|nr:MAG: hypothetical protein AUJ68_05985 [Candidatus Woesearchaeota archaeon CG1_02_57_44]